MYIYAFKTVVILSITVVILSDSEGFLCLIAKILHYVQNDIVRF